MMVRCTAPVANGMSYNAAFACMQLSLLYSVKDCYVMRMHCHCCRVESTPTCTQSIACGSLTSSINVASRVSSTSGSVCIC